MVLMHSKRRTKPKQPEIQDILILIFGREDKEIQEPLPMEKNEFPVNSQPFLLVPHLIPKLTRWNEKGRTATIIRRLLSTGNQISPCYNTL